MTDWGPTQNGFVKKNYTEIIEELKSQAQASFGDTIDLTETSPIMKYLEIVALEISKTWDAAEAAYYAVFVDTAENSNLDNVGATVGIVRYPATFASATITFTGVNGTVVPINTIVETAGGVQFNTTEAGIVAAGTLDLLSSAIVAGTDGNVGIGTITLLLIPIVGITSLNNAAIASGGEAVETDDDFRDRIKNAVAAVALGTLTAIEEAIKAVTGVTFAVCTEDLTTHSASCVVVGVTSPDTTVDDAIDASRPAGISVTWTNPTGIDIYIDTTVDITASAPGDAATQIEDNIIEYIDSLGPGDDVIYAKLYDVIYNTGDWVYDVTILKLDTITPPVAVVNIAITAAQIAQTDAAKIGITTI